jgi:molybdate transport system permease protein
VVVLVARALSSGAVFAALRDSAVIDALALSAVTTTIAVALVLVLGFPLAVLLARAKFRGRALLETIVDLPIVLPPSVAGLALLLAFGRRGLLGEPLAAIGIELPFTTVAVILAQLFVAAPFFIRAARAGIAGVEQELEDAARVDGAAERHVLQFVTIPQAAPALAAGIVTCWARALGEVGATIMFAGAIEGRTQTLPLVVYGEFQSSNLEASIAAAAVLVIAAVAALLAVRGVRWGRALDARGVG